MTLWVGAVLAVTAMGITACSAPPGDSGPSASGEPQTVTVEVSYDELLEAKDIRRRSVTLSPGGSLQVSLGANPSTGFRWTQQMTISAPGVIEQTRHQAIAPGAGRPGAPGSEVWILRAVAPGTATVSTSYGRPWEGGEKDSWTFAAEVTVR
jgi:inhibitor of cysteine peptidase